MSDLRIGISGWRYPSWRGTFYPRGWPQARELEYASRRMNSVEINGSFYVYFDNDVKVRAPFDAMALAHRLGLGPVPGPPPEVIPAPPALTTARSRWPGFRPALETGRPAGAAPRRRPAAAGRPRRPR